MPACGLQLLRNLKEVTHDDLLVGLRSVSHALVDRLRDGVGFGRRGRVVVGRRGERRPREPDPELRPPGPRPPPRLQRADLVAALVHELEALVGHGVELHMRPRPQLLPIPEPERESGPIGLDRQGPEHLRHFPPLHALAEQGVLGIGRHPLDDELTARHTQGNLDTVL